MRCTLLPLDNMKEATAYLPLGDQSLLRGWLLRRSPLCLSSRVGPGVLCVAVVALRVRGAKGFCGRERFWAGEKQRRRKRGTLIRFVVRRRLGEDGFFVPRKRREEKKRKDFHVHTFGFPFSVGLVGRFSWKAFRQPKRTKETRRTRAEQDTNNKEDEE